MSRDENKGEQRSWLLMSQDEAHLLLTLLLLSCYFFTSCYYSLSPSILNTTYILNLSLLLL
ncbi:unnamed protein product, partial [Vitis vinifera]